MKRILIASGLIAALALAAVVAYSATTTAKQPTHSSAACGPHCKPGSCSSGVSAAAVAQSAAIAVSANGGTCPISDPSACPSGCPRRSAGVSAKTAAAKPIIVTVAAR